MVQNNQEQPTALDTGAPTPAPSWGRGNLIDKRALERLAQVAEDTYRLESADIALAIVYGPLVRHKREIQEAFATDLERYVHAAAYGEKAFELHLNDPLLKTVPPVLRGDGVGQGPTSTTDPDAVPGMNK